jgi:hypothetical protein
LIVSSLLSLLSDPCFLRFIILIYRLLPDPSLVTSMAPFIAPCSIYPWSVPYSLVHPLLLEPSLTPWSIVCFLINRSFHCPLSIAFSFAKNSQNRVHEVHLFSNRCILYVLLKNVLHVRTVTDTLRTWSTF